MQYPDVPLGTQNTQNPLSTSPVEGSGGFERVSLTNSAPRNVTLMQPEQLDRTVADGEWSMDL